MLANLKNGQSGTLQLGAFIQMENNQPTGKAGHLQATLTAISIYVERGFETGTGHRPDTPGCFARRRRVRRLFRVQRRAGLRRDPGANQTSGAVFSKGRDAAGRTGRQRTADMEKMKAG